MRSLRLPLPGDFQVSNALVAAGLCLATGVDPGIVFAALEQLEGAPGRLERVGDKDGAPVFVDYAHKPDALEKTLAALRPFVAGRLAVVFGCGGDRDAGKRPMMGAIATKRRRPRLCHRRQSALRGSGDDPRRDSRRRAGRAAKSPTAARRSAPPSTRCVPDDALLIAGKGHETGQIVGDRTLPFSDAETARAALEGAI